MPLFENELGGSFKLEITFGNEAMKTRSDLISAMKRAVETLRQGATHGHIRDENGNKVGGWYLDAYWKGPY